MSELKPQIIFDQELCFNCTGNWIVLELSGFLQTFKSTTLPTGKKLSLNGQSIEGFDSAGALTLINCINILKGRDNQVDLVNFSDNHFQLLQLIETKNLDYQTPKTPKKNLLAKLGEESANKMRQVDGFMVLVGDLATKFFQALGNWRRFQWPSIISNIDSAGIKALPIVGLLSFLIGVVLAYQMGLQLNTYGANTFISYLSGTAIFREFGPLITAIIVAGRTSSAFTAQIGSMKVNEEIDALLTMGLSPTELLVLPKTLALLFVFPLLIFWADLFSVLGAMFMSKTMLGIEYSDFLQRLRDSVGFYQFKLGLYKAPAYAIIIALVGCFQGFRVKSSADSIGSQTTKSVVQALFLIIVADATYSIIYSWLKL
ncbi:MAG: ABC transporter permease [Legionella sp.]|nr:ABC transporter permease [Legionella sp.]